MRKLVLSTLFILLSHPSLAKEYTIKEVSDPAGNKPYYFSPNKLTIQPGDTVTFINAQEDTHDVMFVEVPKGVHEMIMSSNHEREGDKFSYTFKVPGTYYFHCHAHEALGMAGKLIVGKESKPGETIKMDHHKMGEKNTGDKPSGSTSPNTQSVEGVGKINSIDPAKRTINVTHDPIKALGWPKMRMEFQVDKQVDLSNLHAGDKVSFTLQLEGDDNYTVVKMSR